MKKREDDFWNGRICWQHNYIIVDCAGEFPIKEYLAISEEQDDEFTTINLRGAISQFFKDNNIKESPFKCYHNPYNSVSAFGQPAYTTGRFIVFKDHDIDDIKNHSIQELMQYAVNAYKARIFSEDKPCQFYNRKGFYLSTSSGKEFIESKKHKKDSQTFIVEDRLGEFEQQTIFAKNIYQAIRVFFKNNNIVERPYNFGTFWSDYFIECNHNSLAGRFHAYCKNAPRMGNSYNRSGFVVKLKHTFGDYRDAEEYHIEHFINTEGIKKTYVG